MGTVPAPQVAEELPRPPWENLLGVVSTVTFKRPSVCEMDPPRLRFRSPWLSGCPTPPGKSSSSSCRLEGGCAAAVVPCTCSPGKYDLNASPPRAPAISPGLCGGGRAASSGSACLSLTEVPPGKVPWPQQLASLVPGSGWGPLWDVLSAHRNCTYCVQAPEVGGVRGGARAALRPPWGAGAWGGGRSWGRGGTWTKSDPSVQ